MRGALVLVLLGALLLAQPAAAQLTNPPDVGIHRNSREVILSGSLPAPLPSIPGAIAMPDVVLPEVVFPSAADYFQTDERDTVTAQIDTRLNDAKTGLEASFDAARVEVASMRSVTNQLHAFIGDPHATVAIQADTAGLRRFSVSQMAQQMGQSVEIPFSYIRAMSGIGAVGFDLIFILIGLGWILFMNTIEWVVLFGVYILRVLIGIINSVIKLITLVMDIIRTVTDVIPGW